MRRFAAVVLCLLPLAVEAQESPPPRGPADIMNQANTGREQAELQRAVRAGEGAAKVSLPQADAGAAVTTADDAKRQTAGAVKPAGPGAERGINPAEPSDGEAEAQHDHGRDPHTMLAEPKMPMAEPARGLPPGSIEVQVIGPSGQPVPNAEIFVGVMESLGGRKELRAKTGPDGRHVYEKLPTGSQQAYRVNVMYEGAKFSSMPFRLPEEMGYRARIPLRPVTRELRSMFQVIGQTVVELRDDRLHITQQAKLANAGGSVIVFPKDGLEMPLPEGFTAFNWQDQMSDQKGEELAGKGFRIRGSLPPGSVTLAWTFDLERSGESAKIPIAQPFRTYQYRVISEAPAGLSLRVTDFPEAERVQDQDRDLLFTQVQSAPTDSRPVAFTIKLDGIPGPGPGRWIALVLALAAMGYGLSRALKQGDDAAERKQAIATRKQELLALAKQLDAEREREEIGAQYHAEKLDEILTELALVLRDEDQLQKRAAKITKPAAKPA